MSGMVRRKVRKTADDEVVLPSYPETVDWTRLPYDTVIYLFSVLSNRDRANLSSTCKTWRSLGISPCLWQSLDLRAHKCEATTTSSLASRCVNLQKLRFRGAESADAIVNLNARGLREISGEYCRKITDATLSVIAERHRALESLQLGPDFCDRISSDAIEAIAICCPNLRKLRLSGIRDVDGYAVNALAKHCLNLIDIGFVDCQNVDEVALGNIASLQFLSVAGTAITEWHLVSQHWTKLPNLKALDVSRTNITRTAVLTLLASSESLKVLCALHCPALEESPSANEGKGKLLLVIFTDIFKGLASLFADIEKQERNVFSDWRNSMKKNKNLDEIMTWVESILSHSLLRIAESSSQDLDNFWHSQGVALLLNLVQSSQEDVQERAATILATFLVIANESASIDVGRAKAVVHGGGIRLLLDLARSWREGLQSEATKAIANLSVNADIAKAIAEEGGIYILSNLARSMNRSVAEEAAGGLWSFSAREEHKSAIVETGGVKALVDLIFKWCTSGNRVLECAASALGNLAGDDKGSMEIAAAGGLRALVMLARTCKLVGVLEQAARALANLAAHGDSSENKAAVGVGQEEGAIEALVQLTHSPHEGVREEAATALGNLSFDDQRNPEAIVAAGGIEALVSLACSCSNASPALQERIGVALWGLSVSEENRIAIGQGGGIAPLIALARSAAQSVQEIAVGALSNLALNPVNALRIVEDGGVPALIHVCSSSPSKMARFMAALAMAYMFDERTDEFALVGIASESTAKMFRLRMAKRTAMEYVERYLRSVLTQQTLSAPSSSLSPQSLLQIMELAHIEEADQMKCSGLVVGRFMTMLRHPCFVFRACASFALLQFTIPGGKHALHNVALLREAGAPRVLRATAAATIAPPEAKLFARIVLRNLECVDKASCGKKAYVHCKAGRWRSTTIVLCYLMTPEAAHEDVRFIRPRVQLAASQWQVVQDYDLQMMKKLGSNICMKNSVVETAVFPSKPDLEIFNHGSIPMVTESDLVGYGRNV